jgi:hypothetical protein
MTSSIASQVVNILKDLEAKMLNTTLTTKELLDAKKSLLKLKPISRKLPRLRQQLKKIWKPLKEMLTLKLETEAH